MYIYIYICKYYAPPFHSHIVFKIRFFLPTSFNTLLTRRIEFNSSSHYTKHNMSPFSSSAYRYVFAFLHHDSLINSANRGGVSAFRPFPYVYNRICTIIVYLCSRRVTGGENRVMLKRKKI